MFASLSTYIFVCKHSQWGLKEILQKNSFNICRQKTVSSSCRQDYYVHTLVRMLLPFSAKKFLVRRFRFIKLCCGWFSFQFNELLPDYFDYYRHAKKILLCVLNKYNIKGISWFIPPNPQHMLNPWRTETAKDYLDNSLKPGLNRSN